MRFPVQVYIGKINVRHPSGRPSAQDKYQVDGQLQLTPRGLTGDEQAERFHGGPDRALCHYPREHYTTWAQAFPERASLFNAPAMGENISSIGMTEQSVFIGDIYRWGPALIQVTQPRSPCFKLNMRFAIRDFSEHMQNQLRCGWLYRVLAGGDVAADAPLELMSRLSEVSVADAGAIAWHMPFDEEQYRRLLSTAGLAASWSQMLQTRLITGRIENFNHRLFGK